MTTSVATPDPVARRAAGTDDPSSQDDGFDVLDTCHRRSLEMVAALRELTARLPFEDADDTMRAQAHEIERFFSGTARLHHEDEERHVFPALVAGGRPEVVQAVLRLQQDHGWLEEDWLALAPQLQALAAGYGGVDPDLLREGAEVFEALYRDHIALEESFIYPRARAALGSGARAEMGREMAARRRGRRDAV